MLAIYTRISKKKSEGKDTSIETQQNLGTIFADKHFMKYQYFSDRGFTGTNDDRPEFQDMIWAIKKGKITAVWVYDQSRLERNEEIWMMFQGLIVAHKIDYYVSGNKYEIDNELIRMAANMASFWNASYARTTSKNVKASYALRINSGKWIGVTPYGYKTDENGILLIDKGEEIIVKRIFDMSLSGIGAYTIANKLNDEKIPTKYNRYKGKIRKIDPYTRSTKSFDKKDIQWRGNVISDIIKNPIYKGHWITNMKKNNVVTDVIKRTAPAIIPEELYDEVIANLAKNKKNVGKREEYNYLLNGLVLCSCGKEMRGKKRPKGKDSAYKCGGGTVDCRGMNIAKLETFIVEHLFISRDLQTFLTNQPKIGEKVLNQLKSKLDKKSQELKNAELTAKRFLNMMKDPELNDDIAIAEEYKSAKKRQTELIQTTKELTDEIFSIENDLATTRFFYAINNFKIDQTFDVIKRSVHNLVESLTVNYNSEKRYFIVQVKYRGFEERATFKVDTMLFNWKWLTYERARAYTVQQLDYDRSQFAGYMSETFGINAEPSPNWEGGVTEPVFAKIVLEKENLIRFD